MDCIIECVPNFSEGRDKSVIERICDEIKAVENVSLLDVDPGKATNRTVVTFVGEPGPVIEAAFRAVKKAAELIDMSRHHGEHPRFGATDVCPLIPVSGISMEETVEYAHKLAKRIGEELEIPVYCYENAAREEKRRNLATVRSGEYEGLREKLKNPDWKPDYGPDRFHERAGATAVGARDFLVAYNVNLNTTSTRRANAVAFDVREKGRVKRKGNPLTGEIVKDEKGEKVYIPGSLKSVKGIGWYIEEYGIAQISMNLTNISVTSIHQAFDEVSEKARLRGLRVTGSELVGLVPLKAMLDAGRHYLKKQNRSAGIADEEIIKIAVKSMGLDDLYPFRPEEKIIEYKMKSLSSGKDSLVSLTLKEFINETASESPAPGGGSVSAYLGSLGAALGSMVANLSAHKRGWDDRWEEFSILAEKGKEIQEKLLMLTDKDTEAFDAIMEAFRISAKSDEEKKLKEKVIEEATLNAIKVPLSVMETAFSSFPFLREIAEKGNPNSISDVGVGVLATRAAIRGAWLNVKINAAGIKDKDKLIPMLKKGKSVLDASEKEEKEIIDLVDKKIG